MQVNRGSLAEQFVGQEFFSYSDPYLQKKLFFWQREKTGSSAEIDYIYETGFGVIPIEVKAGKTGRLKSINAFLKNKKSKLGVRISSNPLSFSKGILSLPFYLINQLPRLLEEIP